MWSTIHGLEAFLTGCLVTMATSTIIQIHPVLLSCFSGEGGWNLGLFSDQLLRIRYKGVHISIIVSPYFILHPVGDAPVHHLLPVCCCANMLYDIGIAELQIS